MKIIAIGDTHTVEGYDNYRFSVLGEFAAEELHGVEDAHVVQIGDWSDVIGFNRHGKKIEMEGARWKGDIDATHDALDRFMEPFYRRKKRLPQRWITLGNHENRVDEYVADHPSLQGTIGSWQLGFEKFGFNVIPFRRTLTLNGVNFVHHLSGQSRIVPKVNSPSNGFKARGVSWVVGHSHIAMHHRHNFEDGRTVHGIDLGCAIHKNMGHQENWSCQTAYKYDRGVWVFDNVRDGDFDVKYVRLETLGC